MFQPRMSQFNCLYFVIMLWSSFQMNILIIIIIIIIIILLLYRVTGVIEIVAALMWGMIKKKGWETLAYTWSTCGPRTSSSIGF